jgi:hypothetical protein
LSAKYRFKLNKFTVVTQGDFHQLFNQLENVGVITDQNPFFFFFCNTKNRLGWKINDKNKEWQPYFYNTTNLQGY